MAKNREGYEIIGRGKMDSRVMRLMQIDSELEEKLFEIKQLRAEKKKIEDDLQPPEKID